MAEDTDPAGDGANPATEDGVPTDSEANPPADDGDPSTADDANPPADDGDADPPDWETVPDADERAEEDPGSGPDADADEPAGEDSGSGPDTDESEPGSDAVAEPGPGSSGEPGSDPGTAGVGGGDPVLRTRGLTRRFGELVAVDSVDLSIARGEFRSVIGPNGAGKTTLFNLITGALAPSEGTVEFDGEDVTGLPPHERVRRGLGRSFQITNVFGGLTVRENVRLAAQAVHRDELSTFDRFFRSKDHSRSIREATDRVLERIGLAGQGGARAGALAYGDRRRLEIGLVLATDPEVILLDEPTAGMSVDETRETMRLIDDVLADRTLVLIEHDIDLVMDVSDRVTVLHRGSVLATGTPREVADDPEVQTAYLGGARP